MSNRDERLESIARGFTTCAKALDRHREVLEEHAEKLAEIEGKLTPGADVGGVLSGKHEPDYAEATRRLFTGEVITRDVATNTSDVGGVMIPTSIESAFLNKPTVAGFNRRFGAIHFQTDSMSVNFPMETTPSTFYATSEAGNITQSEQVWSKQTVTLSKIANYGKYSSEFAYFTVPAIFENIVASGARQTELFIDNAILSATTYGMDTVVNNTVSGANLTASLDSLYTALFKTLPPAVVEGAVWVMSPSVFGKILTLKETTSSAKPVIEAAVNGPELRLLGRPVYLTEKGTSSTIYLGSPRDSVAVAHHSSGLDIFRDQSLYATTDQILLRFRRFFAARTLRPENWVRIVSCPTL